MKGGAELDSLSLEKGDKVEGRIVGQHRESPSGVPAESRFTATVLSPPTAAPVTHWDSKSGPYPNWGSLVSLGEAETVGIGTLGALYSKILNGDKPLMRHVCALRGDGCEVE